MKDKRRILKKINGYLTIFKDDKKLLEMKRKIEKKLKMVDLMLINDKYIKGNIYKIRIKKKIFEAILLNYDIEDDYFVFKLLNRNRLICIGYDKLIKICR